MKMNQGTFLDRVIRQVHETTKANSYTEKVVIIDKKKGKAIPKKPLFGGNFKFYIVANNDDAANIAERKNLICKVIDFANDCEIGISITYRASCNPGNEERVAEALCHSQSPSSELDNKIKKWIARFPQNNTASFLENYFFQVEQLREYLTNNVQEEVGISLHLKISLDKEEQLRTFPIDNIQFSVYVNDCNDELSLQLSTELIVDEQNKVKAILNYGRELLLANVVKAEVKNYLSKNVTLHKFCYHLKDTVRQELLHNLNRILINYGRKLEYLSLASNSVTPAQELLNDRSYDIVCTVKGYPQPIIVQNKLYMIPKDIGRYRAAQSPNLETWVKSKLESIIKPLLLQKEYIDILLDFHPIEDIIKAKIEEAANALGYHVDQIVSVPDLEPLKLKDKFLLGIEDTFPTKDARVDVKLSISVTAKIPNLASIKHHLNRQDDVKDLIKSAIYDATREYLTQTEPERFYMRFAHYDKQLGEKQSVEQELIDKIRKLLEESFAAQVSSIVPKYLDTDIAKCFQELRRQIGSIEFEVFSLKGRIKIKFQGDFQVLSVEKDSWYIFRDRQPKINDIKESIERSLKAKLNTFDKEDLQYDDLDDLSLIERVVNQWARNNIIEQFGLEIYISNLTREHTEEEQSLYDAQRKLYKQELEEYTEVIEATKKQHHQQLEISFRSEEVKYLELDKLYQRRLQLTGDEENEAELVYVNERIRELETGFINPSLEDARSTLNRLQPRKQKGKGFSEVAKKMNFLKNKANPEISSGNDTDTPDGKI